MFSVDAKSDICEEVKVNPDKYAKAVENHLVVSVPSVTPSYIHHSLISCIHQAKDQGAGLKVEEIAEGSELSNKIGECRIC